MPRREITMDRFTRGLLTVLTALLAVIAVELWVAMPDGSSVARAQIPDTGLQRLQIIEEARKTNQILEQIREQLREGCMKVRLEDTDKSNGKKAKVAP